MGHATQTGSISASCRNPAQEMQRTGARERNCASKQVKPHTFDQACALPTASSPFNPTRPAPTTIIPASCRNPASRHSRCSGQARASRLARTGYRVQAARSEGSLHLQAARVLISAARAPAPPRNVASFQNRGIDGRHCSEAIDGLWPRGRAPPLISPVGFTRLSIFWWRRRVGGGCLIRACLPGG